MPHSDDTKHTVVVNTQYNNLNPQVICLILPVHIITEMDQNALEWASITGMDIKINLFYATKFIILPYFILTFQFLLILHLLKCI